MPARPFVALGRLLRDAPSVSRVDVGDIMLELGVEVSARQLDRIAALFDDGEGLLDRESFLEFITGSDIVDLRHTQ